jgi:hypothetical protein
MTVDLELRFAVPCEAVLVFLSQRPSLDRTFPRMSRVEFANSTRFSPPTLTLVWSNIQHRCHRPVVLRARACPRIVIID